MLVLKMLENKNLVIVRSSNAYKDENNAGKIKVVLQKTINNIDLTDCNVYLNFINQQNVGNSCDITSYIEDYLNICYIAEIPLQKMFTCEPGNAKIWVKILHIPTEMVAKTNEVNCTISSHKDFEGTIPEQELSIIDNLTMKLNATEIKLDEVSGKVGEIDNYVSELQTGDILLLTKAKT